VSVRCGDVPQNGDREGLAKARVAGEVYRLYIMVFGRAHTAPAFIDRGRVAHVPCGRADTGIDATSILRDPSPGSSRIYKG
jgi:hypothetical protein